MVLDSGVMCNDLILIKYLNFVSTNLLFVRSFFSTQASTPQITFWNGRIRWVGSLALREMGGGFVHHYITFDLDLDYVSPYLTYLSLTTDSFVYY